MAQKDRINSAVRFIQDLEIPAPDSALPAIYKAEAPLFTSDTEGSAVDKGSMVSFVSGITPLHKSDVLNSTLLAQLGAEKKYNRFTQPMEFYSFYCAVLANVGWVVPTMVHQKFEPKGASFTVSQAVLEILAAIATGNELAILTATLNSLKDPKNERQLSLFDSQSFPESLGTFQISPVGEDDGELVMALAALDFKAVRHVTRFLWFSWESSSVTLTRSAQKCVLNEDVYGRVRQQVIDKLGDNAKKFIEDIEI